MVCAIFYHTPSRAASTFISSVVFKVPSTLAIRISPFFKYIKINKGQSHEKNIKKIWFVWCVLILSFTAIAFIVFWVTQPEPEENNPEIYAALSESVIGTWKHVSSTTIGFLSSGEPREPISSNVFVFREDGTGLRGEDGFFVYESRFRGSVTTHIFEFYSEATDLYEEERWIFFDFVVLPFLALAGIFLLWRNIKKRGYKPKEFIVDAVAFSFPFFLIFFWIFNFQIVPPLALSLVLLFVVRSLYTKYILRQPAEADFFDLPLSSHKGSVAEKYLHTPLGSRFRREWIVFGTTDGEQLKAYIPLVGIGSERESLDAFQIGDMGTLHCRRGKKIYYFEGFEPNIEA